ncbi:hypothetical protein AB1N83_009121 [Pleurotus pulmonarius]
MDLESLIGRGAKSRGDGKLPGLSNIPTDYIVHRRSSNRFPHPFLLLLLLPPALLNVLPDDQITFVGVVILRSTVLSFAFLL